MQYIRRGRGSHQIWWNPENGRKTTIPIHGASGRIINPATMIDILKNLGLTVSELERGEKNIVEPIDPEITNNPEWQNQPWYREQFQYQKTD